MSAIWAVVNAERSKLGASLCSRQRASGRVARTLRRSDPGHRDRSEVVWRPRPRNLSSAQYPSYT